AHRQGQGHQRRGDDAKRRQGLRNQKGRVAIAERPRGPREGPRQGMGEAPGPRGIAMKFGVFDHMDDAGGPLAKLYADRLELIEAYDRSGIYGYHLAEHHSTPLGCAASPGLLLAALTQRTTSLRFGPLVYLLPFYHPL